MPSQVKRDLPCGAGFGIIRGMETEMKTSTVQVGTYGVNCTILRFGAKAWVVDPGAEGERIAAMLAADGAAAEAILLTHGHFDHIGGIPALQRAFPDAKVYIHPGDVPMLGHPLNQCPPDYPRIAAPANVEDCRALGGVTVLETPGHTPGGVCYWFPESKLLLSGDTLFAGSVGRTDFPGGSMARLVDSLKALAALPEDAMVVPGHGPCTTIGREKASNPYM